MSGPPDHIGLELVRAAEAWEQAFNAAMVAAGYPLFAEARGRLIRYIGRDGVGQAELAARAGLTKQAVQLHLVALERDGVLTRAPVAGDRRARRVIFTDRGRAMLAAGDRIKAELESGIIARIGAARFADLRAVLKALAE